MMKTFNTYPALFIIMACLLWSTDSIIRYPVTLQLESSHIIFWENLIGLFVVIPWGLKSNGKNLFFLTKIEWFFIFFLGVFGSAIAGYFFNVSLQKASPSTFSFLQIFQPFFVVCLATYFLKEKWDQLFVIWGGWFLINACLIHSYEINIGDMWNEIITHPGAILMGLSAMVIWAICTVIGKKLLESHKPSKIFFWRWIFATLSTGVGFFMSKKSFDYQLFFDGSFLLRLVYISFIAGAFAMWLYYKGLKALTATSTSIIELSYPALGMVFSAFYIYGRLTGLQMIGILSFFAAIFVLVNVNKRHQALI